MRVGKIEPEHQLRPAKLHADQRGHCPVGTQRSR
jgi:hypothetical protein